MLEERDRYVSRMSVIKCYSCECYYGAQSILRQNETSPAQRKHCAFGTLCPADVIVHFSRFCEVLLLQKIAVLKGIDDNSFYEFNFPSFEIRDLFQ